MPRISIILPLYNGGRFLKNTISKIRAQTFRDWELLVVNDGSVDDGESIARQEAAGDSRIKVFRKPNGGISSARNYGLSKAEGDYIAFSDQDDEVMGHWLQALLDGMSGGMDLAVGGKKLEVVGPCGKLRKSRLCRYEDTVIEGEQEIHAFLFHEKSDASQQHVWNCLYRRELLERHKVRFDEQMSMGMEDVLFNICYGYHCARIHKIPQVVYHYRQRVGISASTKYNANIAKEYAHRMECISRLFGFPDESDAFQMYGKYALRELCNLYFGSHSGNPIDGGSRQLLIGLRKAYLAHAPDTVYFNKKDRKEAVYAIFYAALQNGRYWVLDLAKRGKELMEKVRGVQWIG